MTTEMVRVAYDVFHANPEYFLRLVRPGLSLVVVDKDGRPLFAVEDPIPARMGSNER